MKSLLSLTRFIDRLNQTVGELMSWAVLVVALLAAGNAVVRKVFSTGSNAALELQLYLFAAIFLLNSGYTLLRNEHIRIDVLTVRLPARVRAWIDIVGITLFLLPMAAMTAWMTLPLLARTFVRAEHSPSEGGLLLWPAWAMVIVGFVLLILQALAELVKRAAELRGIALEPPSGGGEEELDPLSALIQQRQGDDEQ